MQDEGLVDIDIRGRGAGAFARRKQWWSFEGLDPERQVYFVFLAMRAFPVDFVSLTAIDLSTGKRVAEEQLGPFRSAAGARVGLEANGRWGRLKFSGCAEDGWRIEADTSKISADVVQSPLSPPHRNRLVTRRLDYSLLQFVHNRMDGRFSLNLPGGKHIAEISGYGYFEHAWGVQPRFSAANWMHFWSPAASGVVMDCLYDSGVPHHYTYLWRPDGESYLFSPARFAFNPAAPESPWRISSPDLELTASPIHYHRMRKKIPPIIPYFDIDYHEQIVRLQGTAFTHGEIVRIDGFGKFDFNLNKW